MYHYYLASTNQTTYEHRKGSYAQYLWRPFDAETWFSNFKQHIFQKKNPKPYFEPLELYDPDT